MPLTETEAWGSELASWSPLVALLVVFGALVAGLLVAGRGGPLERIPDALERLTGMPGWAVASAGTAVYGLMVAGEGFYSDVWWHIALGRDEALFTAPHTSIVVGLGMIFVSAAIGVTVATITLVDTRLRIGALRVPWSMVPLAALGGAALVGFPLDELWHQQYGIDVTMWSPTHMLMILGASFTGMAAWLVLADAGVSPRDSRWARGAHVVAALLTVMGLSASQGEFEFGVPQFQLIFLPLLVTVAAGFSFVVVRLVLGKGWAGGLGVALALARLGMFGGDGGMGGAETRSGGLYLVSALVVEVVGLTLGTGRRLRFAVVSGVGVATLGLAGEWVWNQGAHQPWNAHLMPDAVLLCLVVGVGAAAVGTAFGGAVAGEGRRLPVGAVAVAGAAVVVGLALPLPRAVGDVTADIALESAGTTGDAGRGDDEALVQVRLDPADASDEARWFQTMSWQGGGLVVAEMDRVGPGEYVSERPVPVSGRWKTLVRLHRGGEMMAAPVYMPADPAIDEPEVPAVDRTVAFGAETEYLLREAVDGAAWLAYVIYAALVVVGGVWVAAFVRACGRLGPAPAAGDETDVEDEPHGGGDGRNGSDRGDEPGVDERPDEPVAAGDRGPRRAPAARPRA